VRRFWAKRAYSGPNARNLDVGFAPDIGPSFLLNWMLRMRLPESGTTGRLTHASGKWMRSRYNNK
jgi:hypothetical protein